MRTKNQNVFVYKFFYGMLLLALFVAAFGTQDLTTAQAGQAKTALPTTNVKNTATPMPTPSGPHTFIVGGTQADPGEWPWQVAIVYNTDINNNVVSMYDGFTCGGSLIGSQWVLTAAHCLKKKDESTVAKDEIDVIAGIHDLKDTTNLYQRMHVDLVILNTSYNASTYDNDIALLKLVSPVIIGGSGAHKTSLIQLVPSTIGNLIGIDSWTTGWGKTSPTVIPTSTPQATSQFLFKIPLPIRANAICSANYSLIHKTITDNMVCAGSDNEGKSFCDGDSGGPLVINNGGNWNLAGIVSNVAGHTNIGSDGCALPNFQGVYTRVSKYIDWIRGYLCDAPITINTQGSGTATTFPSNTFNCGYRGFASGTTITLMATASPGWSFSHWIGTSGGASTNYTTTGPATITAVFTQNGGSADTTQPTGAWTSPGNGQTISARNVSLNANASDDSSGVQKVQWSAKWNNQWTILGIDNAPPYSLNWDMCTSNVPNGDVELGLEIWDNANNHWIYSEHFANYHINKNYNCTTGGTSGWTAKYYNSHDHWWDINNYNGLMCQETINSTGLDKNYLSAAPCNNGVYDNWVAEYNGTINFASGNYVFQIQNDDGLKMWANGTGIADRGGSDSPSYACPAHYLSGNIPIRVILNEEAGDAQVKIGWTTDTSVCNLPNTFNKTNPSDGTTIQSTTPLLEWNDSSGQKDYAYCIDTSNNNNCDTGWQGVGNVTSKSVSNLTVGTYYWQVRAQNVGGDTYANSNTWWSFTIQEPLPPDNENPLANWTVPTGNEQTYYVTNEIATLTVSATDNVGISRVSFSRWDALNSVFVDIADSYTSPYSVLLDSSSLNMGANQIIATAYDYMGNASDSSIWLYRSINTTDWAGEYYNNQTLSGAPVLLRSDSDINFDWQGDAPDPSVNGDNFSARWTKNQNFTAGNYRFHILYDDGGRLFIDDMLVHDGWNGPCCEEQTIYMDLSTGNHTIKMEMFENSGWSSAQLWWENMTPPTPIMQIFTSTALQDGWVLESSETSKKGGSMNTSSTTISLGDDKVKKQYIGILSFATGAALPDTAVITQVTLKVKKQGIIGKSDPVKIFQGFMTDIKNGTFGTSALQTSDFQTAASKSYGPFKPALTGGWYILNLTSGKAYINKLTTAGGLTQIRLRFKLDDNNDAVANILSLYSGNAPAANRPQLVITYYVP